MPEAVYVRWVATNESIRAALEGLNVLPEDNIVAVLGSGDVSFAMVAQGAHVYAFDRDVNQVRYVQSRMEQIRQGDLDSFLSHHQGFINMNSTPEEIEARAAYFRQQDVWDSVKKNVGNLVVDRWDILEALKTRSYGKAYLSNVPGWLIIGRTEESRREGKTECREFFRACRASLPSGGLVYRTRFAEQEFLGSNYPGFGKDMQLTTSALAAQEGRCTHIPEVFRRI